MMGGMTEQRVTPYLVYDDPGAALEWLAAAFGFREVLRYAGPDGQVNHAEMEVPGGGRFMLGGGPGHPGPGSQPTATTPPMFVHVTVDDVDAHYEQARAAGATIVGEPADQEYGDRRYDAKDLEGHQWSFGQRVRDVAPEDWGATVS